VTGKKGKKEHPYLTATKAILDLPHLTGVVAT
jgi:hypothetical protein